jgi:hypothetical protein
MSEKLAFYQSEPTKYIVFTICAIILIQLLRTVFLEISGCETARNNAIKAYNTYEKLS